MPTDDELTTLLRRGFAQATADLNPKPDLVQVIRRQHLSARRRRLAAGVGLPTAALAAGAGFALAGQNTSNHTPNRAPSHTAVAVAPPSVPAPSVSAPKTPHTSIPIKPASYKVVLRNHGTSLSNCPANATTAPFGKSTNPRPGVWFWTKGQCYFVAVGGADTKPADAVPLQINGYPGLYGTLADGVRTIYAPGIGGRGWWVLIMPATAPPDMAVRVIVPVN